jgi:cupin fold WbuC family metalloprotein
MRFKRDDSGYSPAYFLTGNNLQVNEKDLDSLELQARSTKRNCRICVFQNPEDPLHAMMIAQHRGMDSRPRLLSAKPKIFSPLRGRLLLILFDGLGNVLTRHVLRPLKSLAHYVPSGVPYVDLPIDDVTIHFEITVGPLDRVADRNFPMFPWDQGPESRQAWRNDQLRWTKDG